MTCPDQGIFGIQGNYLTDRRCRHGCTCRWQRVLRPTMMARIALVIGIYPKYSETFIAQEVKALEDRGFDIAIYSLRRPVGEILHGLNRAIRAKTIYLPEGLAGEEERIAAAWRAVRAWSTFPDFMAAFRRDFRRDPTRRRVLSLRRAVVLAHEMRSDINQIHAHFMNQPATVSRYAGILSGLPWSCSAHAIDIWLSPEWEKREVIESSRWVVTCTRYNEDHLKGLSDSGDVFHLYHGVDRSRFPRAPERPDGSDGSDPSRPVHIYSVGRLVEKKGYDSLLHSLALLPPRLNWKMTHIGEGKLLGELHDTSRRLGLCARIEWLGKLRQEEVLKHYRRADIFVLSCKIAADGNRDGLPNALLEAQSQGVPVVSTSVAGIPELIAPGLNGLLVCPGDHEALATALSELIRKPALRARMGAEGQRKVRVSFDFQKSMERLSARFLTVGKGADALPGQ